MAYTLGQAARAAGKSKPTIQRAIKSGKLSAARNDDGTYSIEPAEVHRVYQSPSPLRNGTVKQTEPGTVAGSESLLHDAIRELRERFADKDAALDDLRHRLDASEAERRTVQAQLTALLTDQRPTPPPVRAASWWRRFGR